MTTDKELDEAAEGSRPSAASPFAVLRKRADFLKAARGRKAVTPGFILQIRARADDDPGIRVGFTCSRKVGNAVARNRAKRRLREVARLGLPGHGAPGHDYVLIGRAEVTATRDLRVMIAELQEAVATARG